MKIRFTNRNRILAVAAAALTGITLVGWKQEQVPVSPGSAFSPDTLPNRDKQYRVKPDFDRELKKLEEAKAKLGEVDVKRLTDEISIEIEKIDFSAINKNLSEALANLKLDIDINTDDIKKAMADVQVEVKNNLEKVNAIQKEEIRNALKEAAMEIKNAEIHMKDIEPVIRESMEKAKEGIDQARSVMSAFQQMITEMEKDNLLKTNGDYTVELRADEVFINDTRQSAEVSAKYRKYFSKDNKRIRKRDGNISISRGYQQD